MKNLPKHKRLLRRKNGKGPNQLPLITMRERRKEFRDNFFSQNPIFLQAPIGNIKQINDNQIIQIIELMMKSKY